jgi:hypothetical protein
MVNVRLLLLVVLAISWPASSRADAIMRTQAMSATTIAEFFVQDEGVELHLEIGMADLKAFANLLPDELYQKVVGAATPLSDRLPGFMSEEFVIIGERGDVLSGRIVEMRARERVVRDEISGEPLQSADREPETVLFVRIEYPFDGRPDSLSFGGGLVGRANVGFVVYHETVAVNDFRYLMPAQTLELDWTDPWYSAFEARALRRSYFAPMSGFLYVEPFEVRKEIIARPKDLQSWIDLGLDGRRTIPVEMQQELKRLVGEFLREHQHVLIDGREIEPELTQVNFLERTLTSSRVIDPPREIDLNAAILGAIFVYETVDLPQTVTMDWDLFNDRIRRIPVSAVDQAGPMPSFLEPDDHVLEWRNFLKNPTMPTLTVLSSPPGPAARVAALLRWPALAVALALAAWCVASFSRRDSAFSRRLATTVLAFAVAAGSFWWGRTARPSDEIVTGVVSGLLHNVYRAFDFRGEERIYDVLSASVDGDLLTRIYLEVRQGLELANQGGARVKVRQIDLVDLDARPGRNGGILATATWNVRGSVGHWGHVHQRNNQVRAELDIEAVGAVWKLTGIEILEEQRL